MTWGSRHGTRVLTHTHIIKPPFQIWKNPLRESSAAIDADGARVAHIGHLDFTLQRCRLNLEHRAFSSTKMVNLSQQKMWGLDMEPYFNGDNWCSFRSRLSMSMSFPMWIDFWFLRGLYVSLDGWLKRLVPGPQCLRKIPHLQPKLFYIVLKHKFWRFNLKMFDGQTATLDAYMYNPDVWCMFGFVWN